MKCCTRRSTSWNQDWHEKYKLQICRWNHPNGRKWRVNKEPLDKSERGEWKSLKLNIQKPRFMEPGPISSWQIDGKTMETVTDFIFLGSKITADGVQSWNQKTLASWKKSNDQPRQHIKRQRHHFADRGLFSQSYGFSSGHVWMWELDYKESWAPRKMLLNCGVEEDSWESLRQQGDQTSQL